MPASGSNGKVGRKAIKHTWTCWQMGGVLCFLLLPQGPKTHWHCREIINPSHQGEGAGLSHSLLRAEHSIGTPRQEGCWD